MKIVRTTARGFRLPLRERMVSSRVTMTHRELVLVEIETDAGITGTGWCTTAGVGGMAAKALIDAYLAPTLIGEDPRNTERLWRRTWMECHAAGPGGITTLALSALDIALSFADQLLALEEAQLDYKGMTADRDRLVETLRAMA